MYRSNAELSFVFLLSFSLIVSTVNFLSFFFFLVVVVVVVVGGVCHIHVFSLISQQLPQNKIPVV